MSTPLPLKLDTTYSLEELYKMNHIALHKMADLFQVQWWNANLPQALRERIVIIPNFINLYDQLTPNQQWLLAEFCERPGQPVPYSEIYTQFTKKISRSRLDKELMGLIKLGWLIEGNSPPSLLAVPDFSRLLPVLPDFRNFFEAELPPSTTPTATGGQWLADLTEVAAFIYREQPKITNRHIISKQALRKLMPRLSATAAKGWEEAIVDSRYTPIFALLLSIIQETGIASVFQKDNNNYALRLNPQYWYDFANLLAPVRLLLTFTNWLGRLNSRIDDAPPFLLCLLQTATEQAGHWYTATKLMSLTKCPTSDITLSKTDPFASEYWLQDKLLEPLLYWGLMEHHIAELPASWTKNQAAPRMFWRLTALGLTLGCWLKQHGTKSKVRQDLFNQQFQEKLSEPFKLLILEWDKLLLPEALQELIIQPDLSFIVPRNAPPYLIWLLSVFGNTQIQDYVYQGNFSRDSILQGLKTGMHIDNLISALKEHSKLPVASHVWQTLEQWSSAYGRTLLSQVLVLSCDSPEMATEIAAQSKLANTVLKQIGPQSLLIKAESEATIRKWLEKKNWVPLPGIADSQQLKNWLIEKEEEETNAAL